MLPKLNYYYEKYKPKLHKHIKTQEERVQNEIRKKYVQIYKSKLYKKSSVIQTPSTLRSNVSGSVQLDYQKQKNSFSKVVIFDLDETLGSFSELECLWSGLNEYNILFQNNVILLQKDFNELIDLYPEFLRYGILGVLEFLCSKKKIGECFKIYIYTNNQCPSIWTHLIANYFSYVLKTKSIFDQLVCAFKIKGEVFEEMRTSHDKSYCDFIRCTMLPNHTEMCFLDNTYFSKMKHDKVYYIQPQAYHHGLTYTDISSRFEKYPLFKNRSFYDFIKQWFETKGSRCFHRIKSKEEYEIDILVSHKMLYHIKEFFFMTTKVIRTKKMRSKLGCFTRKNRS